MRGLAGEEAKVAPEHGIPGVGWGESQGQAPRSRREQTIPEECDSQHAAPGPEAAASPGNLLVAQILKDRLTSTKSETLGWGPGMCVLTRPPLTGMRAQV